jgi:hypothetical protein
MYNTGNVPDGDTASSDAHKDANSKKNNVRFIPKNIFRDKGTKKM